MVRDDDRTPKVHVSHKSLGLHSLGEKLQNF
jgi:hypothetical protein